MEGDLNRGVNANFESRDFNFGEFLTIHWTCLVQSGLSDVSANCKDCCRALIELTSMFDSWQVTAVNPTEDGWPSSELSDKIHPIWPPVASKKSWGLKAAASLRTKYWPDSSNFIRFSENSTGACLEIWKSAWWLIPMISSAPFMANNDGDPETLRSSSRYEPYSYCLITSYICRFWDRSHVWWRKRLATFGSTQLWQLFCQRKMISDNHLGIGYHFVVYKSAWPQPPLKVQSARLISSRFIYSIALNWTIHSIWEAFGDWLAAVPCKKIV